MKKFIICVALLNLSAMASTPRVTSTAITAYKDGALVNAIVQLSGEKDHKISSISPFLLPDSLMVAQISAHTSVLETFLENEQSTFALHLLTNESAQEHQVQLTYLFKNMVWKPSYALYFSPGYKMLKFSGWIDIINQAGIPFDNVKLQFVDAMMPSNTASELRPKSYTYDHPTNIPHNNTKRIHLFNTDFIKVKQDYRVIVGGNYLEDMAGKCATPFVETWVTFQNAKDNGVGMNLPKGVITLYYQNKHDRVDLLGNAEIAPSPVGEEISVRIPSIHSKTSAEKEFKFIDTKLEQNQFRRSDDTNMTEAHYKLELKNNGNELLAIRVMLDAPQNAEHFMVIRETHEHQVYNGGNLCWNIPVPAKATIVLKYQIRYMITA